MAAPGASSAAEQSLSLFAGITDDRGDNVFSMGLDYEYHFSELIGVGALVDVAGGDVRSSVLGIPVFFHPVGGLFVLVAPGIEFQDDDDNEFLVRLGVGWEFELSEKWTLAPVFNIDFVDSEEVYVYGVELGYRFGG